MKISREEMQVGRKYAIKCISVKNKRELCGPEWWKLHWEIPAVNPNRAVDLVKVMGIGRAHIKTNT